MTNTQQIPWKRLSVEAIAIVASILLAFAIDAWWDDRQERELEQKALLGLHAEYQDHQGELSRGRSRHLGYLRAIESLVNACAQSDWQSNESTLDSSIFALQVPETTDLGEGVRDTLISSGRIEILSDRELRYELTEWDSELDELLDDQLWNRDLIMSIVIP